MKQIKKIDIRWGVFIPAFILVSIAAITGIVNNKQLSSVANAFFSWSLDRFGWLYQIVMMVTLVITLVITFSKIGKVRIGGKDAKPKYSFWTWFAMTLTGGVATGIVTWGVNEPLIYYGNIYGELDGLGIKAFTPEAARFAMARCFYNWTFFPYAIYALAGILMAYIYYNKKKELTVTATLEPVFGDKINRGIFANIVNTLSMMALILGLCSGLTMCIILITTGLSYSYNIPNNLMMFIMVGVIVIILFTTSSYIGLDKGLQKLASLNAWFYYGLLILLIVMGPKLFMARNTVAAMAEWLDNFWKWGLDPIDIGGAALTQSWTMFDWAIWIAYAPVTGIFLGVIAHGRTIKEFMIVNFILPSVFGLVWFAIWGNNALMMQISGQADLVGTITQTNAVTALWQFLQNMPFGLGLLLIPVNIFIIVISFVTAADATANNVASMCIKDVPIGSEAPGSLKVLWGVLIGTIAIILAAYGGTAQGVEGMKAVASAGGFVVLFIFILQLAAAVKIFFIDEIEE